MYIEVVPLGKSIFMPLFVFTSRCNVIFKFPFISFNRQQPGCLHIDMKILHPTKAQKEKPSGCVTTASWLTQKSLDQRGKFSIFCFCINPMLSTDPNTYLISPVPMFKGFRPFLARFLTLQQYPSPPFLSNLQCPVTVCTVVLCSTNTICCPWRDIDGYTLPP